MLLLMGITLSFVFLSGKPDPTIAVRTAADGLAGSVRATRLAAVSRPGEAHLHVDTTSSARFLTHRSEGEHVLPPPSAWAQLEEGVRFGAGVAATGPMGEPITAPLPTLDLVCTKDGSCALPSAAGVYYLTHEQHPETVYAVLVTRRGDVTVFRRAEESGTWE